MPPRHVPLAFIFTADHLAHDAHSRLAPCHFSSTNKCMLLSCPRNPLLKLLCRRYHPNACCTTARLVRMSSSNGGTVPIEALISSWVAAQEEIASKVDCSDQNNNWSHFFTADGFRGERDLFVAGADVSFSTTEDLAIGTVAVVKLYPDASHELVLSKSCQVSMTQPYLPTFLGFREAPVVSTLLNQLPEVVRRSIDCLLVDGNGLLHPRKAGLACHVGVEQDIPCIGVSKTLLYVDGLDEKSIRDQAATSGPDGVDVVGESGFVWGKAIMTGNAQRKPIYVSVGHRVSLSTSSQLVLALCDYRVPAPIRYADLHSRAFIRGERNDLFKKEEFISSGTEI